MSGVITMHVEGLQELDAALGELPKSTARGVLQRVLKKAAEPIVAAAKANAPYDTGELRGSIVSSTRVKNTVGDAEFSAAMKQGLGRDAAVSALRSARRAAAGEGSFAEINVGPTQARNKKDAIKRIVQEFGSLVQKGHPYMRPAWDAEKEHALDIIKNTLGDEIIKTAERAAKRKAAKAAKIAAIL